jgi:hypothetical protein
MTEATLRCESTMAELTSGALPIADTRDALFLDDPQWEYSLEVMPALMPSLVRVTVTVLHRTGKHADVEASLARWFANEAYGIAPSLFAGEGWSGGEAGVGRPPLRSPPPQGGRGSVAVGRGFGVSDAWPSAIDPAAAQTAPLSIEEMLGLTQEAP